jgi:hypothetical protein
MVAAPHQSNFTRIIPLAALLVMAAGAGGGGCSSSKLVGSWQDTTVPAHRYSKILVVGVAHREDLRRIFEDDLCRSLREKGATATPSYKLIASAAAAKRDDVVRAVRDVGADAVLITRLVKKEQRVEVTPGYVSPAPYAGGYYGYYNASWQSTYVPPAVTSTEVVAVETRMFDTAREAMVWTATTETFDPANTEHDVAGLVKVIVSDLVRRQLIGASAQ